MKEVKAMDESEFEEVFKEVKQRKSSYEHDGVEKVFPCPLFPSERYVVIWKDREADGTGNLPSCRVQLPVLR